MRTRVQIRSFAPSVLLLSGTPNGRKLQRRSGGQRFLRQEGQHRSPMIARTFERELGFGFFNTVPPPDMGDRSDLSPFFLSYRALFLRVLVAARFDLWICEVENSLYYTYTGVLQL